MTQYRAVSLTHIIFGGKQSCLKRFCVAGSDQKIGIDWGQFKGDVPEALDVVFNAIGDSIYTRYDDYRANVTYITLDNLEDATNLMSKTLTYDDQKIDLYQTVKMEEDIMTVNIPNFKEISITKMIELVTKQLKPLGEIKEIIALCNKYRNEYIPYGMKVLLRKNTIDTELPLFLDHEDGRIKIFYRGCKEACTEESKVINDTKVSTNDEAVTDKQSIINRQRGTVGLKKPPASSIAADEIPSSSIEKVSSGDDTESDGSTDDNNQPLIKRTTKSTINSDNSYDISMDSDTSSPMEIKKEFIPPNPSPKSDSDGYSPPSAHTLMAEKARIGKIS
ncbi:hypothetical protein AYI70_g8686 [Smittium culicis]|uniref:Uncharacterized protein n=1 Tax=Smittium culicis TaxID=133412 RepID=A0A1R1XES8_9FUNG|nr:hypothetical protein AYI70_g8686 [Smittium culicis]